MATYRYFSGRPPGVARASRAAPIGKLDKGRDEARANGWTVVDMKQDWTTVFPSENK